MKSRAYKIWYFFVAWLVRLIFWVVPHGQKNEPSLEEGPYIVCSNHIAATDPVVICDVLKKQQPRFMAKKELFSVPLLGKLISSLGAYPVDRAGRDAGVLVKTVHMLESGCCVGLFPQGTRRPGQKPEDTPVRNGAGLICSKSKAQVLPVKVCPKGYKMGFLRPTHVYVGKPISYDEYTENGKYAADFSHITQYIFSKICELGPEDAKNDKQDK